MNLALDWQSTPALWMAYDADMAEGASDSCPEAKLRGFGKTEREAINDFIEQYGELRAK